MRVWLSPQTGEWVTELVESGRYYSPSEVVEHALQLLAERHRIREMKLQELRKEVQKGLDSGPSVPFDIEEFKKRVRARLAEEQANQC